jgi:ribosomal protein S18 acetylase RimI-like enzyme
LIAGPDLKVQRLYTDSPAMFLRSTKKCRSYALPHAVGMNCNIAVHPGSRGQGIGRSLLEAALAFCRQSGIHTLHLEVRTGNAKAISLYKKCGFVHTGKRPGYYQDNGEDALLFTWMEVL